MSQGRSEDRPAVAGEVTGTAVAPGAPSRGPEAHRPATPADVAAARTSSKRSCSQYSDAERAAGPSPSPARNECAQPGQVTDCPPGHPPSGDSTTARHEGQVTP